MMDTAKLFKNMYDRAFEGEQVTYIILFGVIYSDELLSLT